MAPACRCVFFSWSITWALSASHQADPWRYRYSWRMISLSSLISWSSYLTAEVQPKLSLEDYLQMHEAIGRELLWLSWLDCHLSEEGGRLAEKIRITVTLQMNCHQIHHISLTFTWRKYKLPLLCKWIAIKFTIFQYLHLLMVLLLSTRAQYGLLQSSFVLWLSMSWDGRSMLFFHCLCWFISNFCSKSWVTSSARPFSLIMSVVHSATHLLGEECHPNHVCACVCVFFFYKFLSLYFNAVLTTADACCAAAMPMLV